MLSLKTALEQSGRCWWVAPSFPQSSMAWRELKALATQIPEKVIREDARLIRLPGGGEITVKSADAPESLRGEGLDLVVLDEAAYIAPEVWTDALRPTLSDRKGAALMISTPCGHNWFWEAWSRGQEGRDDWHSWQYPTSDNPLIDLAEIEAARESLPESTFSQEYLAAFIADGAGVFRNVRACATATRQERPVEGHTYQVGVDWGRSGDYTVFAVFDCTTRELCYLDRFTGVDYVRQRERLLALYERFSPVMIKAEANSMGLPIIEQLQRDRLPVRPFVTTQASKMEIVDSLALAFERMDIRILNDPILIGELESFASDRTPTGMQRYAARVGHDDCVMALAIVQHSARRPSNSAVGAFA